jgi:hypothetical protein
MIKEWPNPNIISIVILVGSLLKSSYIGHLENTGSVSHVDVSNVEIVF